MKNENALVEVLQPTAPAPDAIYDPRDLPEGFNEWFEVGRGLYERRKALEWECADWVATGIEKFPAQMTFALNALIGQDPIEQKKVAQAAKVAASIPPAQRCTALTFQHHAHVADLPLEERLSLLNRAQQENWSARATRIFAIERRAALGVGNTAFEDDDFEYIELMAMVRGWNRARQDARESFLEMANDAKLGVIEA